MSFIPVPHSLTACVCRPPLGQAPDLAKPLIFLPMNFRDAEVDMASTPRGYRVVQSVPEPNYTR